MKSKIAGIENCKSKLARKRAEELTPRPLFAVLMERMCSNQVRVLRDNLDLCGGTLLLSSPDRDGSTVDQYPGARAKTCIVATYYGPVEFAGVMRLCDMTSRIKEFTANNVMAAVVAPTKQYKRTTKKQIGYIWGLAHKVYGGNAKSKIDEMVVLETGDQAATVPDLNTKQAGNLIAAMRAEQKQQDQHQKQDEPTTGVAALCVELDTVELSPVLKQIWTVRPIYRAVYDGVTALAGVLGVDSINMAEDACEPVDPARVDWPLLKLILDPADWLKLELTLSNGWRMILWPRAISTTYTHVTMLDDTSATT